jgi:hypothetical protein
VSVSAGLIYEIFRAELSRTLKQLSDAVEVAQVSVRELEHDRKFLASCNIKPADICHKSVTNLAQAQKTPRTDLL